MPLTFAIITHEQMLTLSAEVRLGLAMPNSSLRSCDDRVTDWEMATFIVWAALKLHRDCMAALERHSPPPPPVPRHGQRGLPACPLHQLLSARFSPLPLWILLGLAGVSSPWVTAYPFFSLKCHIIIRHRQPVGPKKGK